MSGLRSAEVTVAAVTALKADSALTTALGGQKVYSNVPEGVAAPYVLMGGSEETTWAEVFSATGDDGARHIKLWFEVVSKEQGLDEVENISSLAIAVLTSQASFASLARFAAVLFAVAQQPFPVEVNGVRYLTRPCSVEVFLS